MNKQNKKQLTTQDKINIARKIYNDEIAKKVMRYQKQYDFEISPRQGHELWNNEGDAFKHAYMAADLALNLGQIPSLAIGIYHENETPNNPRGEWNMDSWNNKKGREIAKEIMKEYGKDFYKLSTKQQDDIKAIKIMQKMQSGQLINSPNDNRKFNGFIEKIFNNSSNLLEKTTGQVASINYSNQLQVPRQSRTSGFADFKNPLTGNNRIFTREDVGEMSGDEFKENEKEINAQLKAFKGSMPSNDDLHYESINGGGVVYVKPYTRQDGVEVKGYYRSR